MTERYVIKPIPDKDGTFCVVDTYVDPIYAMRPLLGWTVWIGTHEECVKNYIELNNPEAYKVFFP